MDAGFGPAVHQARNITEPLPGYGVEYIQVSGIQVHFIDPGVVAAAEDFFPGLAAIDGLVQSAIAAARP